MTTETGTVTFLQIAVLALVQGITEFLPISSSGHLILVPELTDWPDQGLVMDIAVHLGTLFAVLVYFRRDVWQMLIGVLRFFTQARITPGGRLAFYVIIATIPVIVAGYYLKQHGYTQALRSAEVIGWTTLGFGIVLYVADKSGMTIRRIEHFTLTSALVVGVAQVLALIPGTSRSGITITAARLLGVERPDAARFSMLLSVPVILGAGLLAGKDVLDARDVTLTFDILLAAGLAFLSALIAIALMMNWLRHAGFTPFVIYRLLLGIGLLTWVYWDVV